MLDPIARRARAFAALRELLARLAVEAPVVMIIDDLQWADADSLALLTELMRPEAAPSILLVATARSTESDAAAPPTGEPTRRACFRGARCAAT